MELKDWLTLIVPLIFDGLLLFVFQQAINRSEKRENRRNEYKYETLIHFLEMLQRFYAAFKDIQKVDPTISGKNVTLSEVWNPAADLMQQLENYYRTHSVALENVEPQFQECMNLWQYIIVLLRPLNATPNGELTTETRAQLNQAYISMWPLIQKCLKECEIQIIKM